MASGAEGGRLRPLRFRRVLSTHTVGCAPAVSIDAVAAGGWAGHELMAVATSTRYLVLRHVGARSASPVSRMVPWFPQPARRVVGLAFSPDTAWLMAATAGGDVFVLPVSRLYSAHAGSGNLVARGPSLGAYGRSSIGGEAQEAPAVTSAGAAAAAEAGFNLEDATRIRGDELEPGEAVTCAVWWTALDGNEFAILGGTKGTLVFVDLLSRRVRSWTVHEASISGLELLRSSVHVSHSKRTQLVVHTVASGGFRLLLEERVFGTLHSRAAESISFVTADTSRPGADLPFASLSRRPQFQPRRLPFPADAQLAVQELEQGPVVAVLHGERLALYDADTGLDGESEPWGAFAVPAGSRMLARDGQLLLLATAEGDVVALSVHAAAAAADGNGGEQDAVVQRCALPPLEPALGAQLRVARRNDCGLRGALLWTERAVYELRPRFADAAAVARAVARRALRGPQVERAALALGLRLEPTYEALALRACQAGGGDVAEAQALFALARTPAPRVAMALVQHGHAAAALEVCARASAAAGCSPAERAALADLRVRCHSQLGDDEPLRRVLASDADFAPMAAIEMCLGLGRVGDALRVALARQCVPTALELLAARGLARLDPDAVDLLREQGHIGALVTAAGGAMVAAMPAAERAALVLPKAPEDLLGLDEARLRLVAETTPKPDLRLRAMLLLGDDCVLEVRRLHGSFDAAAFVAAACDCGAFEAAAAALELGGEWRAAIECRLRGDVSPARLLNLLPFQGSLELLTIVAAAFLERGGSLAELGEAVVAHSCPTSAASGSCVAGMIPVDDPWWAALRLPAPVMLRVATCAMACEAALQVPSIEPRLWTSVTRSLDPGRRLTLTTTADSMAVAFTCGHSFPRRDLVDTVLPRLEQHLAAAPVALPVTTAMLSAELSASAGQVIQAACPVCAVRSVVSLVGGGRRGSLS